MKGKILMKILAVLFIGGGIVAIPYMKWDEGEYDENVPNRLKETTEEATEKTTEETTAAGAANRKTYKLFEEYYKTDYGLKMAVIIYSNGDYRIDIPALSQREVDGRMTKTRKRNDIHLTGKSKITNIKSIEEGNTDELPKILFTEMQSNRIVDEDRSWGVYANGKAWEERIVFDGMVDFKEDPDDVMALSSVTYRMNILPDHLELRFNADKGKTTRTKDGKPTGLRDGDSRGGFLFYAKKE